MVNIMYYYLNIFFLLSILGHIIENFIYVHVDSGILFGPWTPIYGIGTLVIIGINNILKNNYQVRDEYENERGMNLALLKKLEMKKWI